MSTMCPPSFLDTGSGGGTLVFVLASPGARLSHLPRRCSTLLKCAHEGKGCGVQFELSYLENPAT